MPRSSPAAVAALARAALKASGVAPAAPGLDDRFERLEVLGSGSMGVVYRARDRKLGREVALKVLAPDLEGHPEGVARFRREAEALAQLSHPDVVALHELIEQPRALVLELVRGEPLAAILARGDAPPRELVALVARVARAIHHAHERGLVHRDLKPSNILVAGSVGTGATRVYEPKVVDWGIVHLVADPAPLTLTGAVLGTRGYMAPEQAAGDSKHVDARTDVFSLGAILFEVLTGTPPDTTPPTPPRALAPWVPRELEAVVLRALETDPGRRHATALELVRALEPCLADDSCWQISSGRVGAPPPVGPSRPGRVERAASGRSGTTLGPGAKLGPYTLVELLGMGGMGEVFRARDGRLDRDVALKIVRPDHSTAGREARFVREIAAASRIRHPNLVAVHATGVERGVRYLVTELVAGEGLDVLLEREGALAPRRVAAIGRKIALALEALHRAGIVHRDVKPGNLVVDEHDEPKLLDFGIARVETEQRLTRTGEFLGSPVYAAPEQLADTSLADARADVYALGATLYHAATGSQPFPAPTLVGVVLSKARLPVPPSRLRADRDPALDSVCLRCLEPRAEDRYQTARDLAAALETAACAPAAGSRRPLALAVLALVCLGVGGALVQRTLAGKPDETGPLPLAIAPVESGARSPAPSPSASPERARSIEPELLAPTSGFARTRLTRLVTAIGSLAWHHPGAVTTAAILPGGEEALTTGSRGAPILWDLRTGQVVAVFGCADGELEACAPAELEVSPDGQRAASVHYAEGVAVWDVAGRRLARRIKTEGSPGSTAPDRQAPAGVSWFRTIALLPDGRRAVVGRDEVLEVMDLETGARLAPAGLLHARALALAVDRGGRVCFAVTNESVATWACLTPSLATRAVPGGELRTATILPDATAVVGGCETYLRRFRLEGLEELAPLRGPASRVRVVRSSAQSGLVWAADEEGWIHSWDAASGVAREPVRASPDAVTALALAPDGVSGLAGDRDGRLVRFGPAAASPPAAVAGHAAQITGIEVTRDGEHAVTCSLDATVRTWDLASREGRLLRQFDAPATALALSPDGDVFAVGLRDGFVRCGSLSRGAAPDSPTQLEIGKSAAGAVVAFGSAHVLASVSNRRIGLFDPARPELLSDALPPLASDVVALACTGDGQRVVSATPNSVQFWNVGRRVLLAEWAAPAAVAKLALVRNDTRVVVGTGSSVHVLDLASAKSVARATTGDTICAVAGRGALAATSLTTGRIQLWRLEPLALADEIDLSSCVDHATALAFSPDGKALVAGTARGLVLRFELARGLVSGR